MAPSVQPSMSRAGASDSEDDLATAAANGTRKANNTKSKMQKPATAKTTTATKRKAATKQNARQPLKDRTNVPSDVEDMDGDEAIEKPKAKRAKTTTATRKPKKAAETLGVIPETQQDAEDIEQSIEEIPETMNVAQAPTPPQVQRFVQRPRSTSVQPAPGLQPRASARSVSAQPTYPQPRQRSGSASGTERERRGGDPELRRKFNDLSTKYDNLNLKYQNLQEIGSSSADSNFEKLKRASDQKAKDADALIASLKKEISELRKSTSSTSSETTGLQKQVSSLSNEKEKLSAESTSLREKLQTSQNEVKSLEAKLVVARRQLSASAAQENAASAPPAKTGPLNRSVMSSNASEAQKEAKMKENLYADLTGLIINGVKRKEGEDDYDCIQTGQNGTLHFHLTIQNETNPQTPNTTGNAYDDAEFRYYPDLDTDRDRTLIDEILPDFMVEDLNFPRSCAYRFFNNVFESMTKRVVIEGE